MSYASLTKNTDNTYPTLSQTNTHIRLMPCLAPSLFFFIYIHTYFIPMQLFKNNHRKDFVWKTIFLLKLIQIINKNNKELFLLRLLTQIFVIGETTGQDSATGKKNNSVLKYNHLQRKPFTIWGKLLFNNKMFVKKKKKIIVTCQKCVV